MNEMKHLKKPGKTFPVVQNGNGNVGQPEQGRSVAPLYAHYNAIEEMHMLYEAMIARNACSPEKPQGTAWMTLDQFAIVCHALWELWGFYDPRRTGTSYTMPVRYKELPAILTQMLAILPHDKVAWQQRGELVLPQSVLPQEKLDELAMRNNGIVEQEDILHALTLLVHLQQQQQQQQQPQGEDEQQEMS